MTTSRTALSEETGVPAADIDRAARRLEKRGVTGMVFGKDEASDGKGGFTTVEVYYSDRATTMLRHVLANQDLYRDELTCDCYARAGRFEDNRPAVPGAHDEDCVSQKERVS